MRSLVVFCVVVVMGFCQLAHAEQSQCVPAVWSSVQKLQPLYYRGPIVTLSRRSKNLTALTEAVCEAASETGIDPLIAISIARRESSLLPFVGLGKKNGFRGERGYFQVMPDGYAENTFAPGDCSQHVPRCNAITAFRYMAFQRDRCEGGSDPWVWVEAYGTGSCHSPAKSRESANARLARAFYCDIVPECSESWPE